LKRQHQNAVEVKHMGVIGVTGVLRLRIPNRLIGNGFSANPTDEPAQPV